MSHSGTCEFSLDSVSNIHVMSLEAARILLEPKQSKLKILGVGGVPTEANVEGKLVLKITDGDEDYHVDLGTSYGVAGLSLEYFEHL
jgi:hypothetical protein